MQNQTPSPWKQAFQSGLIGGGAAVLIALVGMVAAFGQRFIVSGWFTMGQVLYLAPILFLSYRAVRLTAPQTRQNTLLIGMLSGLVGGALLAILVLLGQVINLRAMLINASPALYEILTFGQGIALGIVLLLLVSLVMGAASAGTLLLPERLRGAVIQTVMYVVLIGLLRDLIITVTSRWGPLAGIFIWLFAKSGLTPLSAILLLVVLGGLFYWRAGRPAADTKKVAPQKGLLRYRSLLIPAFLMIIAPPVLGIFFAEILDNVGLYILMGLGLNIVVGFAGLLDLGYVAFYAIGAYLMGVFTSPELGFFNFTFWQALPFALVGSVLAGIFLGLPVLKMRGDYLAIVTLGFGEIVRLLALSDWLKPWLGGSQGIQQIQTPHIGPLNLHTQAQLYYLFLVGIAIVAFIATRLKDSRVGRSWMALREDEDVAVAMGINSVMTKLMAFATGALFSGLAGTIFAAKLNSVYPHSMNFLVSINVLSLIIIGGMGSIPGVFVGALVLIGAPDLLREFAEYRYLAYGALLVVMMLTRPEGLWPEERRRLELHEAEELATVPQAEAAPAEQ
jgi:branched-chain amino acid transport system permease protein